MSYIAVAGLVVSVGTSIIAGQEGKKQAEKQLELQKRIALAQLAEQEKVEMEKLRIEQELGNANILASNLTAYRIGLQKESTARLKDTGIYVAGLGAGMGSFYGLYLMFSKD
jgi:hypothetical protein